MKPAVCIVGTGGTFDKAYNYIEERMSFDGCSCIPEILSRAFIEDCSFESLFQVDSLEMSEQQRSGLASFIRTSGHERFVVVHGTSRMVETGIALSRANLNRTVVLTGALRPFRYDAIEASVNLGSAIAVARLMEHGVKIFMNGTCFDPESCRKDPETGMFRTGS